MIFFVAALLTLLVWVLLHEKRHCWYNRIVPLLAATVAVTGGSAALALVLVPAGTWWVALAGALLGNVAAPREP